MRDADVQAGRSQISTAAFADPVIQALTAVHVDPTLA